MKLYSLIEILFNAARNSGSGYSRVVNPADPTEVSVAEMYVTLPHVNHGSIVEPLEDVVRVKIVSTLGNFEVEIESYVVGRTYKCVVSDSGVRGDCTQEHLERSAKMILAAGDWSLVKPSIRDLSALHADCEV